MTELRIAFVGQCHTVGYPGVPADEAFPEVCRNVLQAARPGVRVSLRLGPYYHPAELSRVVQTALRRKPRVVVIEVIGWLAVTGPGAVDLSRLPRHVRSTLQRVQHFQRASRIITRKTRGPSLVYQVRTTTLGLASDVLRPLFPRYARPTISEYESAIIEATRMIAERPSTAVVLQGPGALNVTLDSPGIATDALDRYRAVAAMCRRVAASCGALHVERWDTVVPGFYLPESIRPTRAGHSVWGHLLADELLRAGIV